MIRYFKSLKSDIDACFEHDPAARNVFEILFAYPGFHSRQFYRISHTLWKWKVPFFPRFISHIGRFFTGIEIHPGAILGEKVFIDHGMGVVIGETAEVGNNVVLYQGVTLGGTSTQKIKRHPTLVNNIIVGSGAKLIGAITIGDNVKIGSGSVIVTSVPPNATVVGVPGRIVKLRNPDTNTVEKLPDPVWERIQEMEKRIADLEKRPK
jgi:serine O-acetyltransferase